MSNAARIAYWVLVVTLAGFGWLALPTIGLPFRATGIALAGLAPFRRRPAVFWPWLVGLFTFFAVYVLVAPLACSSRKVVTVASGGRASAAGASAGDVACITLLGLDYAGGPGYDPSRWPAALAGAAAACGVGLTTRIAVARRSSNVHGELPWKTGNR